MRIHDPWRRPSGRSIACEFAVPLEVVHELGASPEHDSDFNLNRKAFTLESVGIDSVPGGEAGAIVAIASIRDVSADVVRPL